MHDRREEERDRMVAGLRAAGVRDVRVLDAMERVPRHLFVPPSEEPYAYEDRPLPIGFEQTISQPYVVGKMLEALHLEGSENVLDIGSGSGYQAALLGLLAREVHSVERIPQLAARAAQLIRELGFGNVQVSEGDGSLGLLRAAPYQAIICAAAASHLPMELLKQLAPGGRLVIPIGQHDEQRLMRWMRRGDRFEMKDLGVVRFVPLIEVEHRTASLF